MGRKVEFNFPLQGKDINSIAEKQPLLTSPDLENVRPQDVMEKRFRGGQRPAVRKWSSSRIGGGDYRIDKLVAVGVGTSEWVEDNQMTWLLVPYVYSCGSISMAATVVGAYYGVEYEFDCTDNTYDSGWQDSNVHTITGLTSESALTFRCRAREKSPGIKVTDWSSSETVTPNAKPQPDPLTWATEPYAISSTEISMVATTATDPSGVEYYFTCESGAGGSDRDWADSASYTDSGLTENTEYCYSVEARDKSGLQCEGAKSPTKCATTYPYLPQTGTVWKCLEDNDKAVVVWAYDTGSDWCRGIYVNGSSNVYVGGDNGTDDYDIWKLNSSGVLQWGYDVGENATHGTSFIRGVVVDSSGNVYCCGERSKDGDNETGTIRQLNSSGTKQWVYDTQDNDNAQGANDIAIDTQGDIIVVGLNSTDEDSDTASIRKLNSSGVKQWDASTTHSNGVCTDGSDNIYVGTQGNKIEKYNSAGALQWDYSLGAWGTRSAVDSSGNVYVASFRGEDEDGNTGSIRKLNSSGVLQWHYDIGAGADVYAVTIDSSGNVYAVGIRTGNKSIWKLDNDGNLLWADDNEANTFGIFFDGTYIYIAGGSWSA